jgi:hypothetical protein
MAGGIAVIEPVAETSMHAISLNSRSAMEAGEAC